MKIPASHEPRTRVPPKFFVRLDIQEVTGSNPGSWLWPSLTDFWWKLIS